jgi:chitinase
MLKIILISIILLLFSTLLSVAFDYNILEGYDNFGSVAQNMLVMQNKQIGNLFYEFPTTAPPEITTTTAVPPPDAPTNLSISNVTTNSFLLKFTPSNAIVNKYSVYSNDGLIEITTNSPVIVNNLSSGSKHVIYIVATNAYGTSVHSDTVSVRTLSDPPGVPTNITATDITSSSVTLNFAPPAGPVDIYNIYSGYILVASGKSSPIVINNLQGNTNYKFTIIAIDEGGTSDNTAKVLVKTIGGAVFPPTNLSISSISSSSAKISFTPQDEVFSVYNIYSGPNLLGNGMFSPITIRNLYQNSEYTVTVVTSNENGVSLPSEPISFTTLTRT